MNDREEYAATLYEMSDARLQQEAETAIWMSAFAANNPRSEFHWKVDALYAEARKRDPDTGPDHRGASIYVRAHARVMRQEGYAP